MIINYIAVPPVVVRVPIGNRRHGRTYNKESFFKKDAFPRWGPWKRKPARAERHPRVSNRGELLDQIG